MQWQSTLLAFSPRSAQVDSDKSTGDSLRRRVALAGTQYRYPQRYPQQFSGCSSISFHFLTPTNHSCEYAGTCGYLFQPQGELKIFPYRSAVDIGPAVARAS